MDEVNTVKIPLEEYFDLRTKAETYVFLMNEIGRMDGRFTELDNRLWELQRELERRNK